MMELFVKMLNMDMEYNYFQMVINIKDNISLVVFMEKVNMFGEMVPIMMVIFQKVIVKVKENGNLQKKMEMCIEANIKRIKKMDMEYINGIMVVDMKVLFIMILSKKYK